MKNILLHWLWQNSESWDKVVHKKVVNYIVEDDVDMQMSENGYEIFFLKGVIW